jgi:hypothetical protein
MPINFPAVPRFPQQAMSRFTDGFNLMPAFPAGRSARQCRFEPGSLKMKRHRSALKPSVAINAALTRRVRLAF